MALPLWDPNSGIPPKMGQPVIYLLPVQSGSQWNRKYQVIVQPWAGNHPQSYQPISATVAKQKLEEDLAHSTPLAEAYAKGGTSWDGGASSWAVSKSILANLQNNPGIIQKELSDLQNGTGIFSGALPSWMVEDGVQKFLSNAPTPSTAYFTPEYVAHYTQKNGHPPFAGNEEAAWKTSMQQLGIDVSKVNTAPGENMIQIEPGKWVPKDSAGGQAFLNPQSQPQGAGAINFYGGAATGVAGGFPSANLVPGSTGSEVQKLQNWLSTQINPQTGQPYLTQDQIATGPGTYGPQTTAAVAAWQKANGVDNSSGVGYWGPRSIAAASGSASTGGTQQGGTAPSTGGGFTYEMSIRELKSLIDAGKLPMDAATTASWNQIYQAAASSGQLDTKMNFSSLQQLPGVTPISSPTAPGAPTDPAQATPQNQAGAGLDGGATPFGGTPYFLGQGSLVKFVGQGPTGYMNDSTIWYLDPSTKTIRPFANPQAVANFFDGPVDLSQIKAISAAELMPGGLLGSRGNTAGYELLPSEYAIQADGSAKVVDYSSSQLSARYGSPNDDAWEQTTTSMLDGFLDTLAKTNAGVGANTLNSLRGNQTQLAFYINALAYGGYSLSDVYRDIKKRELGLSDINPISATATKGEYIKTDAGMKGAGDNRIAPPAQIGSLTGTDLKLSLYDLPDEAFKTLVPILDYNSAEFKQKMSQVASAYHDILITQINAQTSQEKAVADYNWSKFREDVERTYGIALSDNAYDAWSQIEGLYDQFSKRGIFNSGMQAESIDDFLRKVRRGDQNLRDERMTKEESERMSYFTKFATPQQIKDLIAAEPDTAQKWGLIPSAEIKGQLTLSALKAKYPNEDEATLQRYLSSVLDENGNYRSNLFQRDIAAKLPVESDKRLYQQQKTYEQALRDEEKAYKEFTLPDSPFLRAVDKTDPNLAPYVPPPTTSTQNFSSLIKNASFGLSDPNQLPSSSAAAPTTNPNQAALDSIKSQALGVQAQLDKIAAERATQQGAINQNIARPTTGAGNITPYAPQAIVPGSSLAKPAAPSVQSPAAQAPINWNAYQPAPAAKPATTSPLGSSLLNSPTFGGVKTTTPMTGSNTAGTGVIDTLKSGASWLGNKITSFF